MTTRLVGRAAGLAALAAGAAGLAVVLTLPHGRVRLQPSRGPEAAPVVAGAFHIHTIHSDGTGTPDEIAAAAARAGLEFVVFTDHGNGTRAPAPPQYRSGVLCLDGVEIATTGGHYIAVDAGRAPYPLGGEARDVVEDVARLGGFGIAAHPDSPHPLQQWREWTAPFDALEWLNADSSWRDERLPRLGLTVAGYPLRPVEVTGSVLDRPDTLLARWDMLTRRRRVVAVAGADAHARLGFRARAEDPYRNGWFLRLPSYQVSFETFALRVELARPFQGDPVADGRLLVNALRAGHVYTGLDALATPAWIDFSARSGRFTARQGDELPIDGPVRLSIRVTAPDGAIVDLRRDGTVVQSASGPALEFDAPAAQAVFRVEVRVPGAPGTPPVPWLVTNPIHVVPQGWKAAPAAGHRPATDARDLIATDWGVEHAATSAGAIARNDGAAGGAAFRYTLGGGEPAGQYAAIAIPAPPDLAAYDRLSFLGRADKPMRVSVQVRRPAGPEGQRWRRSVYLDTEPRATTVFFDDMTPIGPTDTWKPDLAGANSVLLVVDTVHAEPGTAGTVWLEGLRLER